MKICSAARALGATTLLVTGLAAQGPNFIDRVRAQYRSLEFWDLNGDGVEDLVCGEPSFSNNTGRITILDGQTRAQMVGGAWAAATLIGMGAGWLFGWSYDPRITF